jgi:hypothetical protein
LRGSSGHRLVIAFRHNDVRSKALVMDATQSSLVFNIISFSAFNIARRVDGGAAVDTRKFPPCALRVLPPPVAMETVRLSN